MDQIKDMPGFHERCVSGQRLQLMSCNALLHCTPAVQRCSVYYPKEVESALGDAELHGSHGQM